MANMTCDYGKWVVCFIILIAAYILPGSIKAGEYENPSVTLNASCGDTYRYGDTIEVEVVVENADNYTKYGEGSFQAIEKSYTIKAGATGVTWHYTHDNGYEEPQGPEDFNLEKTIKADYEIQVSTEGPSETAMDCLCSFSVSASGGRESYAYNWEGSGNGSGSSSGESASFLAVREGDQWVKVIVADANDMTGIAIHKVTVHKKYEVTEENSYYDYIDWDRAGDDYLGPEPDGGDIQVCKSESVSFMNSIDVGMEIPLKIIKLNIGYAGSQTSTSESSGCMTAHNVPVGSARAVFCRPKYKVRTGTAKKYNCDGSNESGDWEAKEFECFQYQIRITD